LISRELRQYSAFDHAFLAAATFRIPNDSACLRPRKPAWPIPAGLERWPHTPGPAHTMRRAWGTGPQPRRAPAARRGAFACRRGGGPRNAGPGLRRGARPLRAIGRSTRRHRFDLRPCLLHTQFRNPARLRAQRSVWRSTHPSFPNRSEELTSCLAFVQPANVKLRNPGEGRGAP